MKWPFIVRVIALATALAGSSLVLSASEAQAPELPEQVGLRSWKFLSSFELPEVPEPSGMCFLPDSQTFCIVDDGAADRPAGVYEVNQEGQVLNKLVLGKDPEGVCYDSQEGRLFVADEAGERVWVLEAATLQLLGSFAVSREWQGAEALKAGGNGFEGIEWIGSTPAGDGGYLLLLNQDDPHALARVNLADITLDSDMPVRLAGFHKLPAMNCGELYYDQAQGRLWVVHSWQNVYEVLDIDTLDQLDWQVCPGLAQEALCFDEQGRLWIGSDSGGLAVYTETAEP